MCIYVVKNRFIVIKSSESDLELFFNELLSSHPEPVERFQIDNLLVEELLKCVDTEWDKKVIRVLLSVNRSRSEIDQLGMDSDNVLQNTEEVNTIIKERLNAKIAAEDMVKLRLDSQVKHTQEKIKCLEQKYSLKSDRWTKIQLEELQDNISFLTERVDDLKSLTSQETKSSQQKVNAMVKRTKSRLINENRSGKRKLGAGQNLSLNEEDETFILSSGSIFIDKYLQLSIRNTKK